MSVIPEVKCRRCGETFSALRSRCPNCGTRRVNQSARTPSPTPGTTPKTGDLWWPVAPLACAGIVCFIVALLARRRRQSER